MQNDNLEPAKGLSRFARATCWGAGITFLVSITVLVIRTRGQMGPVDEVILANAEQKWQQANIKDYDLEIQISERQQRRYRIQIRNSKITALWRNDRPIKEPYQYRAWTIPGMFQTLRTDVEKPLSDMNSADATALNNLTIRAEFHPTYGFPQRYIRIEHRQQGNNPEISWKIISFAPQKL